MAKATTSKSVMLSVRVPIDLHEFVMARCEKDKASVGATVTALLRAGLAIDTKVHHVSGVVMADPVPRAVSGNAVGFNLKGQDKKGAKRS